MIILWDMRYIVFFVKRTLTEGVPDMRCALLARLWYCEPSKVGPIHETFSPYRRSLEKRLLVFGHRKTWKFSNQGLNGLYRRALRMVLLCKTRSPCSFY